MIDMRFDDALTRDVKEVALLIANKLEKRGENRHADYINFIACLVLVAADFLEISEEEAIGAVVWFMREQHQHTEKVGQDDIMTHH